MKYLFITLLLLCSCGSRKEFIRSNSVENLNVIEQLHADLYRETKLLELLDVKVQQVETRDSVGNVRIETDVDICKKMDRQDLNTTKIQADKHQISEKVVKTEVKKKRSGIMTSWVWIVGFVTVIVVTLVVGVYIVKK